MSEPDQLDLNGWGLYDQGDVHVVPLNDLREHYSADCWCKPRIEEEDRHKSRKIWRHNSLDRREEYETGRKLS